MERTGIAPRNSIRRIIRIGAFVPLSYPHAKSGGYYFGKRSIYALALAELRAPSLHVCRPSALASAQAQPALQPTVDITQVPAAAQPSAHFNADAATEAYMAMIPPAATARSNAYFEGGYWLILWDFLYASASVFCS
jgi:hypothetical protein